jgi:hypothetical protein
MTQTITVSFIDREFCADQKLSITYINQQNLPIVEPLKVTSQKGDTIVAEALFPYTKNEMNGLTIAAVTKGKMSFANADEVVPATIAGPGLIIIN